ncbi:MAG: DUF1761 domain-containing protein [Alphaproteobacteria bacterium]|nr:DUF1761 domain-containing protein [Alphaproteobacteria bacterium]
MTLLIDFPYLQTFVSALLAFGLGLVWYHPKMMGTTWLAARGKTNETTKRFPPMTAVISFLLWLIGASFYSFLLSIMDISTVNAMLSLSCLLWVAFAMPPIVMGSLYTGYPFQAAAIDSAYQLGGYYIFALTHLAMAYII